MMIRRILAFVLVAPVLLFGVYRCSYLPLRCSVDVAASEKELVSAGDRDDRYARIVAGRDALDRLHDCFVRPLSADPPLLTALSYRFLQQHEQSIEWYQRALAVDRRPEIYLGLGTEQWNAGRREEALQSLTLACAFAPSMLDAIEDGVAREEVQRRVIAQYGKDWIPHWRFRS